MVLLGAVTRRLRSLALVAVLATLGLSGCAFRARYDLALVPTAGSPKEPTNTFETPSFRITWKPSVTALRFVLVNRSHRPLRIIWNDAYYMDPRGYVHRVTHAGAPSDRTKASSPTVVPAGARVRDLVFPADHIIAVLIDGEPKGLAISPLLPVKADNEAELEDDAVEYTGKTVAVVLPIEIGGDEQAYHFRFLVESVSNARTHVPLAPPVRPKAPVPAPARTP